MKSRSTVILALAHEFGGYPRIMDSAMREAGFMVWELKFDAMLNGDLYV
jgi:hypothetical protein